MYTYAYRHMHIHLFTHMTIHKYIHIQIHIHIHAYIHTHITYIDIHKSTNKHNYTHTLSAHNLYIVRITYTRCVHRIHNRSNTYNIHNVGIVYIILILRTLTYTYKKNLYGCIDVYIHMSIFKICVYTYFKI